MQRDPVDTIGNTTERVIAPNVWEFIHRASNLYGRFQGDRFGQEMQSNILEGGLESPIEDLFWIALRLLSEVYGERFNPEPEPDFANETWITSPGIHAQCQRSIGPYRVDFFVNRHYIGLDNGKPLRGSEDGVIVELDGHDFHDKDKRQRAYEKARDRYFVKHGYRVLHFTGSEVVADPFKIAYEVLNMLRATWDEYDPENPAGIE